MRDLGTILLQYSLRVGLVSLEPIENSAECDYSDLKSLLERYVVRLQNESHWSEDEGQAGTDEAGMRMPALHYPASTGSADSEMRSMLSASSLNSIARTMLRTLERSSKLSADNPALVKLREAVAEIVLELARAAKKEPKFVLRTGPDLYSRKAG